MIREILFRGKRTDNSEWVKGYYLNQRESLTDKKACYIATNNGYGFNYISVDPSTVGQYTGLTDKNGTRIFEGDIIEIVDIFNETIRGVVYWCNGAFWAGCTTPDGNESFHGIGYLPVECAHIIGNIYDNPELLKGGNENG